MSERNFAASSSVTCRGLTYSPIALCCTVSAVDVTKSAISSGVAVYPVSAKNCVASSTVVANGSYSVRAAANVSAEKVAASPCPT